MEGAFTIWLQKRATMEFFRDAGAPIHDAFLTVSMRGPLGPVLMYWGVVQISCDKVTSAFPSP